MQVLNRSSEKLTFIWTTHEISADDDEVADAITWVVESGKKRFTALASASYLTVICESFDDSQTCRVVDAGVHVSPGDRLFFDDRSIAECSTRPLSFLHRFFPTGTGNSHAKVVAPTAEKVKRGAKKAIVLKNSSAFALIAMWTKEMIPRGSGYVENVQYDVLPNSTISFDQFESDMYLTLVRPKTDLKNYALVMFSKKVERGSSIDLTFEVVCDEKLKLEPADTFFLRFAMPKDDLATKPMSPTASLPPAPALAPAFVPAPALAPALASAPAPAFSPSPAFAPAPAFSPAFAPAPAFSPAFAPAFDPAPLAQPVPRALFPDTVFAPVSGPSLGFYAPPAAEAPYCCPRCGVGYKYTATGARGTPKKSGEPRATMVNCECWSSAPNSPSTTESTAEAPYCCPRCGVGYKYTATGARGTPKKSGEPRATMVNCKCW